MARSTLALVFLVVTLCIHFRTIDARAIEHEIDDEPVVEDAEHIATLLNYRHRFEHSSNIKALKWMFREQADPKDVYCKVCHILLPVVRIGVFLDIDPSILPLVTHSRGSQSIRTDRKCHTNHLQRIWPGTRCVCRRRLRI